MTKYTIERYRNGKKLGAMIVEADTAKQALEENKKHFLIHDEEHKDDIWEIQEDFC
jgi:hypothetical protein